MKRGILDILYQVLASPSKALEEISQRKPLVWAMITAGFIAIVLSLTYLPNPSGLLEVIFSMEKGSFNLTLAIFLWVIIFLLALFIESVIFHLIALLLRGKGSYLGMVCVLCFACFPFVFFAPLTMLRALTGANGIILYPIVSLVFSIWILALVIIAIHQNYHFSLWRAMIACFVPGILLVILPLFIITVLIPL